MKLCFSQNFVCNYKVMLSLFINSNLHPVLLPSDVSDQPQPVGNKKIEFHISTDMQAAFKKDLEKQQNCEEENSGKHILVL